MMQRWLAGLNMPFERRAPLARFTGLVLAMGALVMAAIPTLTSPLAELAAHGGGCADRVQARLFFGLHRPAGIVSESEWETFLADDVTRRFPDGLTVFRSHGQWRGAGGRLEREPSRVVEIIHDDSADARDRIRQIVNIYKTRHRQESVLVTRVHAEVCF
jgi:hypothetical protein